MPKLYKWAAGKHHNVDPTIVGNAIERLAAKHRTKIVQPREFVEDARPKDSPLHPLIEWDLKRAGQLYQEIQARGVIRSVVVVFEQENEERDEVNSSIRAFVNLKTDEGQGYTAIEPALADPVFREQILQRFWRELQSLRTRYAEYDELHEFIRKLDALLKSSKAA